MCSSSQEVSVCQPPGNFEILMSGVYIVLFIVDHTVPTPICTIQTYMVLLPLVYAISK